MRDFPKLKGEIYEIPSQQRGYKWTPANIKELLRDLWEFMNAPENKRVYCLQPLAVVPLSGKYSVLDGQQRLTTLFLLYKYLTNQNAYTLEFVRDNEDNDNIVNRWSFLTNISSKESIELADSQIDLYYIHRAYQTISDCFETNHDEFFSADKELTT